jgi:outer membrane protein TolC
VSRATKMPRSLKLGLSIAAVVILSGCASASLDQSIGQVNADAGSFTEGRLALARTDDERARRADAARVLLQKPLGQSEAVQLALVNSPALQALVAQSWADAAEAAQLGRIPNPMFSFERIRMGDELELGRTLSFGLLDLLTLPSRKAIADHRIAQSRVRLTSDVVDQVTQVRQAWVRAVASRQNLQYAQQVYRSAEAGAELARRMQAVGNFNRITRAREQVFYADAATRLVTATHQATASREELGRLLGLTDDQAGTLQLPDRLPDLPKTAMAPEVAASRAVQMRLDVRLAKAGFEASARDQGLNAITSFTDVEFGVRRDTIFDNGSGERSKARGYELGLRLPLFDWGGLQRDAMNARTLAAANQLEATLRAAGSNLRETYSAYRSSHDVARHHREEVLPLRKVISEENQLRYNGMLIGVFELLADSRDQISTVMAAIDAEQQFWLADAALQAALIGRPTSTSLSMTSSAPAAGGAGH